jgi:hypothetical protein
MILLDTLLVGGLSFVLRRLADSVDAQRNDEGAIKEELVASQLRLELGEIDEAEFGRREAELLARLRELRAEREQAAPTAGRYSVASVEAAFETDERAGPRPRGGRRG